MSRRKYCQAKKHKLNESEKWSKKVFLRRNLRYGADYARDKCFRPQID
jgi:hypothetical protein